MNSKEAAVLVSGGVDSAVAVHLLAQQERPMHLFYIRIGLDDGSNDCSADEDIEICTLIARRYGLPFDVVSLHQEYWDNVMDYALRTVRQGLTPNPDIMCNSIIKFGYFQERWGKDFAATVTGHYASTAIDEQGRKWLATAADPVKDQTDFLARTTGSQLAPLEFPLGRLPKAEVRRIANEAALPNAGRRDSQGICFLGKINYNDFLRRHLGERPGAIDRPQTRRAPRLLVPHHRSAQGTGAQRRPMVRSTQEHTRQCALCVPRLRHRQAVRAHNTPGRDSVHNRRHMGRRRR